MYTHYSVSVCWYRLLNKQRQPISICISRSSMSFDTVNTKYWIDCCRVPRTNGYRLLYKEGVLSFFVTICVDTRLICPVVSIPVVIIIIFFLSLKKPLSSWKYYYKVHTFKEIFLTDYAPKTRFSLNTQIV